MEARKALTATLVVVAVLLSIAFLYTIRQVLVFLVVALVFASSLKPYVDALERRGLHRGLAILILYIGVLIGLGLLLYAVVPPLVREGTALVTHLPQYIDQFEAWRTEAEANVPILSFLPHPGQLLDSVSQVLPSVATGALQFTLGFAGVLAGTLSVFVIAFYWLLERDHIQRRWLGLLPPPRRRRAERVWEEMEARVGGWLRGQLVLCGAVGLMSLIGLSLLGVRYAVFLAVLAGLTEAIPTIGPVLAAIPAILVAFTESPLLAAAVLGLYILVQQSENNILVPKIMERAVGISPLTVLVSMLVGATLLGIAGIILAVPVASAIHVLLQHFVLGEREEVAQESGEASPETEAKSS